jgi:hypothetical protein
VDGEKFGVPKMVNTISLGIPGMGRSRSSMPMGNIWEASMHAMEDF